MGSNCTQKVRIPGHIINVAGHFRPVPVIVCPLKVKRSNNVS